MTVHPLQDGSDFENFSMLYMNPDGQYIEPKKDLNDFKGTQTIIPDYLPEYFKKKIVLPAGVTDVFVWVHGWQNDANRALKSARRLFYGIIERWRMNVTSYPRLTNFVPGFVAVHWPSMSSLMPSGYKLIRDRARAMTDNGNAEFFLASLLGYLDKQNIREGGFRSKTLIARGGFYVHCIGHSFGGRFLTAAIRAAATPQPRTLALLAGTRPSSRRFFSAETATGYQFNVDSALVFQMAAPRTSFGNQLQLLVTKAPLRGPLVLTHSSYDRANCLWHGMVERGEKGIGCHGAAQPEKFIKRIRLGDLDYNYTTADFAMPIVNVDASQRFPKSLLRPEGAHSSFWYEESIHLALSLVNYVRRT